MKIVHCQQKIHRVFYLILKSYCHRLHLSNLSKEREKILCIFNNISNKNITNAIFKGNTTKIILIAI